MMINVFWPHTIKPYTIKVFTQTNELISISGLIKDRGNDASNSRLQGAFPHVNPPKYPTGHPIRTGYSGSISPFFILAYQILLSPCRKLTRPYRPNSQSI